MNHSINPGTMRLRLLFPLLLLVAGVQAQQDPMYSMYMWNMMTIMPGYAGSADVLNVTAISRAQWTGIDGAPVTHSLSGHAPLNRRTLGLGLSTVHDRIGRTATSSLFADLAYRMRISRSTRLAFGLRTGFNHAQLMNTQVENTDPRDVTFAFNETGRLLPNFGAGMYIWSRKGYLGVSVPKLLRSYMGATNSEGTTTFYHREATHCFLTAGRVLPIGSVLFKPAMMVRIAPGAPASVDISANFLFAEKIWIGSAYRHRESVTGIFSMQLNDQLRAGYAYDMGTTLFTRRAGGSHEIMFSYDPVFNRERVRSPRYF
jgi:type IX secretion system PorP/SprF family membrane protein